MTQLATDLDAHLSNTTGRMWEDAALAVANKLGETERQITEAYSFSSKDDASFKSFAERVLGHAPGTGVTPEGIQALLGQRLTLRNQTMAALQSILDKADRLKQRIIDAIGR